MIEWFHWLFSNVGFMPRAICGIWTPGMIFLYNASDFLIGTAYIAISTVLVKVAYAKRGELPFRRLFWLFGLFILVCGTTHFMDIVMFYDPLYHLEGVIKLITAAASWGTVFALFHVTPLALRMRSPEDLEREIEQRQRAEGELRQAQDNFEVQIQERTSELQIINAELNASDEQFRTMANSIPQLAWIARADGFVFWYNRRWHDYMGTTPGQEEEMREKSVLEPEILPLVQQRWNEALATGQQFEMEFPLRGADGRSRIFLTRMEPVKDAQGNVVRWFGTNTDIDEQKRVQQELSSSLSLLEAKSAELLSSEARFRVLAEALPQIVWTAQPDGFVDYFNKRWTEYTGMTLEETQGWGWQPVLHRDDMEATGAIWQHSLETGEPYEIEYRFKRAADSTYRWHLGRALPLRDESGNITTWFGTGTDIDDQKRTEETLRGAQQMLQLVMNHIPQAIFWKDRQSVYLGANYRFAADAGFASLEEIKGKHDFEMPWAEYATAYQADDRQVMETDLAKLNFEEPLIKVDGSKAWLRTSKIPLHDSDGVVMGVLCTYEDITLQKESEAAVHQARDVAERANAAKSEFLSRMSHELRTPLNAILGFGQILERQGKQFTTLQNECVQQILKAGRHQLDLVNEVLDIARIQAPDSALSLEAVDLSEVVQEALGMLQTLAAPAGISLTQQLTNAPPIFILADRQRLLQILLNLLANAIKYNEPGGQAGVSAEVLPENRVCFHIRDTGHGIATENLPKLFAPFVRLNESLGVEGTGLGLVLCQRLAQAMNGSINVESQLGLGSTFSVELPLAQPSTETGSADFIPPTPNVDGAVATPAAATLPTASVAKHTILLIEDNISNFQLIETLLDDLPDVRLVGAMQGGLGVELAIHHRPDLILLDLHLPDIMGDEVLRRLQTNSVTQNIPVLVLSADATPSQISHLLALGARQFLTKPLDVNQFLQTLHETIRAR